MAIILASTSPYRRKQLEDLGLTIKSVAPDCDERSISSDDFSPLEVATKRSELKVSSVLNIHSGDFVIGGDQLVDFNGKVLGKPGSTEKAIEQLIQMRGQTHRLITACTIAQSGKVETHIDITELTMHRLSESQIAKYVETDQPLDCAGAYKIEKSGRWLFKSIESKDATAITGLPLLHISNQLMQAGYWLTSELPNKNP